MSTLQTIDDKHPGVAELVAAYRKKAATGSRRPRQRAAGLGGGRGGPGIPGLGALHGLAWPPTTPQGVMSGQSETEPDKGSDSDSESDGDDDGGLARALAASLGRAYMPY